MAGRNGPRGLPTPANLVKRGLPYVDREVIEAQVEERRQARLQHEEAAKSAAAAAKRPVGGPPSHGLMSPNAEELGACGFCGRKPHGWMKADARSHSA